MVHAGTVEFYRLAVEAQSFLAVELNGTDAVGDADAVGARHFEFRLIEIRIVGRPQSGLGHLDGTADGVGGAVFADNGGREFHMVNVGGVHLYAPVVDIGLRRGDEPDVAVDSRTRVPAAVLLLRIVNADHYLVLSYFNIRCGIYPESRITVRPAAGQLTVDIDVGVHIDTLEVEAHFLAFVGFAQRQLSAIPSFSGGQVGTVVAGGGIDVEPLQYAPVVGQRHRVGFRKVTVVLYELPLVVEQLFAWQFF